MLSRPPIKVYAVGQPTGHTHPVISGVPVTGSSVDFDGIPATPGMTSLLNDPWLLVVCLTALQSTGASLVHAQDTLQQFGICCSSSAPVCPPVCSVKISLVARGLWEDEAHSLLLTLLKSGENPITIVSNARGPWKGQLSA